MPIRVFGLQLRTHPKNHSVQLDTEDRQQKAGQLKNAINAGGFQRIVVFSAGMGFLAGAYELLAVALTMPMIKLVYYFPPNNMHPGTETLLRCATLIGAMVGQVVFGLLADLYGRRKMYGIELYIIIVAILGILMSSRGEVKSLNIFSSLFAWRFVMGIGIGADYPLSATITAEFAPTKYRARMLAWVFYMQPLGYTLAVLMTLAVTKQFQDVVSSNPTVATCNEECIRAVDRAWRIIIGVGAVPAVIAVFFRRSIPESPLYTADVINQLEGAKDDFLLFDDGENVEAAFTETVGPTDYPDPPPVPLLFGAPENEDEVENFSHRWTTYWQSFHSHFVENGYWRSLLGTSLAWCLFDTNFYALGSNSSTVVTHIFNALPLGQNFINCTTLYDSHDCIVKLTSGSFSRDPTPQSMYGALYANSWRSMILVCSGALTGGAIMITLIKYHSPRFFQIFGFLCLIPFFLAAGLFLILLRGDVAVYPAAIIYVLAYGVFEVGPNFTTFMLPAEIFPTRHRAFAHGIAAASGKLGASLYQIYFQFVKFHSGGHRYAASDASTKWLGFTVLCFIPTMLAGALVTWILVPQTRTDGGRTNLSLDELEKRGNQCIWGESIVMVRLVKSYEGARALFMGCFEAVRGRGKKKAERNGGL